MPTKIDCIEYSRCPYTNRINMLIYISAVLLNCLFSTVRTANPVLSVTAVSANTATTGDTVMQTDFGYIVSASSKQTPDWNSRQIVAV